MNLLDDNEVLTFSTVEYAKKENSNIIIGDVIDYIAEAIPKMIEHLSDRLCFISVGEASVHFLSDTIRALPENKEYIVYILNDIHEFKSYDKVDCDVVVLHTGIDLRKDDIYKNLTYITLFKTDLSDNYILNDRAVSCDGYGMANINKLRNTWDMQIS